MFSATFPTHIQALAKKTMKKPLQIVVGEVGKAAANIQQFVEIMTVCVNLFILQSQNVCSSLFKVDKHFSNFAICT